MNRRDKLTGVLSNWAILIETDAERAPPAYAIADRMEEIFKAFRPCGHARGIRDTNDNEPCIACMIEEGEE